MIKFKDLTKGTKSLCAFNIDKLPKNSIFEHQKINHKDMIKHIVLFKFVAFESENAKQSKLKEFEKALYSLKSKFDCLLSIEVGLNVNPNEAFDMALTTTFNSMEDLDKYAKHPDHLEVAKLIGAVKADRACVDFKF
jgi:hypothetical protein